MRINHRRTFFLSAALVVGMTACDDGGSTSDDPDASVDMSGGGGSVGDLGPTPDGQADAAAPDEGADGEVASDLGADMAIVDPDMAVIDPDMAVVDPDMAVIDPDMAPPEFACPADDDFEENDAVEGAAAVPEGGALRGIACPDDADYYRVAAQAGCSIAVALHFRHAEGDLDLRLRNAQGGSLARGATADDDEFMEYDVGEDGDYFVEVRHALPDPDGTIYTLDVQVDCPLPLACPDDDALEENDNRQTASALPEDGAGLEGILCEGDPDFFVVEVGPECTLAVELELDAAQGDLDLVLRDPQGEEIARSADVGDRERIDYAAGLEGATVYAQVVGVPNTYLIRATQDCPIIPECPADDALEDNDGLEEASRVAVGDAVSAIVCGDDEDWFALEVPDECALDVSLDFTHANGDLDLHLHNPAGVVFAESVGAEDGEAIELDDAGGLWYLRVDLKGGVGANRYRLRADVVCPGALECPGDDGFEENDAPIAGPVLQAGVPVEAIACTGDLDYYALEVPGGCEAVGTLDFDAGGALAIDVVDDDGNLIAAGAPTAEGAAARTYAPADSRIYFEVRAGDDPNDYLLTLDTRCPADRCPADDPAEPNGDRDDATPLVVDATGVVCGDDSDWFAVDAEAGCVLHARVEAGPGDAELELTALDQEGELARARPGDDGAILLDQPIEADGPHFLRLANTGGAGQGSYTISVAQECVLSCPADDAFEENDAIADAAPIADGEPIDGILCGEEVDVYAVEVAAGCRAVADLEFDDDGALRLRLTDAEGAELDASNAGRVSYLSADAAVLYYEISGAENDYRLGIDLDCPEALECPADDALEDNDDGASATPLRNGDVVDAIVCGRDHDWYAFEAAAGCELNASLRFTHADGDVDLRLYRDPLGGPIRSSTTPSDNERISFELPADGTYYLDVSLFNGEGNTYQLDMILACPVPLTCPEDDVFEDNDDTGDATAFQGDRNELRAVACAGDPDYYAIDLFEGCTLQADAVYREGDPVFELRDADGNTLGQGAQANDGQVLLFDAPAAATYYLYLAGDAVEYRLFSDVDCEAVLACPNDDPFEENDDPVAATVLPPGGVQAILCEDDADYWRAPAEIGCRLRATLEFDHDAGDLDLAIVDNQGEVLDLADAGGNIERADALLPHLGPFALRVTGAPNIYRLTAELDCSCEEDGLEDNDDAGHASPLDDDQRLRGRLCGFDEDWFEVETPDDCVVDADLSFTHADGNLELELRDAQGERLAFSRSSTDDESISHRPIAGAGTYYLRVSLRNGIGGNDYELALSLDCAPPPPNCFDDIFEDNNGPGEDATEIPLAQLVGATACRGDDDWFAFDVVGEADTCLVEARLRFGHGDGDLGLLLADADGVEIEAADSADDDESIARRLAPGTYHLRVHLADGASDGNAYGLRVDVDCAPPPECEDDPFEDNDGIGNATPIEAGVPQDARVCAGDDDYFAFEAPVAGCSFIASVNHVNANGDLDLRLLDVDGGRISSSETAADVERLSGTLEAAGVHFLRIYLFDDVAGNDYTVNVALDCPVPLECPGDDAFEENDDVASAAPLAEGAGVDAILCADDADYFEIDAYEGCAVAAGLDFVHADGDLGLALLDAGGAELVAVDSGDDGETIEQLVEGAGPHFLAVSGAPNSYHLAVDIACPDDLVCPDDDPLEDNDDRASATALQVGVPAEGIVCGEGEFDYFAIDVEAGCMLSAELSFRHAAGNLNLRLEDAAGNGLEFASSATDDESIAVPVAATGAYYLRVEIDDFGGPDHNEYALTAAIECPTGELVINEVDYDAGSEFLEIYNAGDAPAALAGVELELVDGADGSVYATIDLSAAGESLAPGGYLVVGPPATLGELLPDVLRVEYAGGIQDGPADAARLVLRGEPDSVADAVSWGGVLEGVTEGPAGAPGGAGGDSIGRCANGRDSDDNGTDFAAGTPSAGLPNLCPRVLACPGDDGFEENDVLATAAIFDVGGGAYEAVACGADLDYYQFNGDVGCTARVLLGFLQEEGNLDLAVVDADGVELVASRSDDDDETIELPMESPGPFYPLVTTRDGGAETVYTINVVFECPEGTPRLVINEVDYDQPRSDSRELIELYNAGDAEAPLDGMALDLVDAAGATYLSLDLELAAGLVSPGAYVVIGNQRTINAAPPATQTLLIPPSTLRNQTAGVRLRVVATGEVIDSMSYGGVIDGVTEGGVAAPVDDPEADRASLVRCPDGADTDDTGADFSVSTRTPGRPNACP